MSLKKAGTVLNIRNNKIQIFDKDFDFTTSANGHYAISILPDETCDFDVIEEVFIFEQDENDDSKFKKVVKLHKQFSHGSANNLENLFKRVGMSVSDETDMINKVATHCYTCKLYKKSVPQLAVGLSKTMNFNDIVAMDLCQLRERLYRHFIVEFSGFSNATIISLFLANAPILYP